MRRTAVEQGRERAIFGARHRNDWGYDPGYWRDRVLAADPGHLRLKAAARATLSAAGAVLLLATLAHRMHQQTAEIFVGVMLGMMGSVSVTDPLRRDAQRTLALLPLPTGAAIALGTLCSAHHALTFVALPVVAFLGVSARRYGPRGTALGLLGFFGFFLALFFQQPLAHLPFMLLGVLLATAWAWLLRFVLIPDRPGPMLAGSVRSFRARVRSLLADLADALRRDPIRKRDRRRLRRALARLNETAMALEQQLEAMAHDETLAPSIAVLRARLFELELSAEAVTDAARDLAADGLRPFRPNAVSLLRQTRLALRTPLDRYAQLPEPEGPPALRRLRASCAELLAVTPPLLEAAVQPDIIVAEAAELPAASAESAPRRGLHPATRLAIQAALAVSAAGLFGYWLSPARWYWAVIGCFVVFNRASTLDDTLARAIQRVLGTVVGVAAGLLITEPLHGHRDLELGLVFVFMFAAYYALRVSYAWMVLFFTALIAVFYDLLGRFTPGILVLRLEETLIGATTAVVVSAVVLPTHTRGRVIDAVADVLRALGELLPGAGEDRRGAASLAHLQDSARELDRKLLVLRDAARPLSSFLVRPRGSHTLALAHAALGVGYYARLLVPSLTAESVSRDPSLEREAKAVAVRALSLAEQLDAHDGRRPPAPPKPSAIEEIPAERPLHWLHRIEQLLGQIAFEAGLVARHGKA